MLKYTLWRSLRNPAANISRGQRSLECPHGKAYKIKTGYNNFGRKKNGGNIMGRKRFKISSGWFVSCLWEWHIHFIRFSNYIKMVQHSQSTAPTSRQAYKNLSHVHCLNRNTFHSQNTLGSHPICKYKRRVCVRVQWYWLKICSAKFAFWLQNVENNQNVLQQREQQRELWNAI